MSQHIFFSLDKSILDTWSYNNKWDTVIENAKS